MVETGLKIGAFAIRMQSLLKTTECEDDGDEFTHWSKATCRALGAQR